MSRIGRTLFAAALIGLVGLAPHAQAHAGQPIDPSTLNPPPPSQVAGVVVVESCQVDGRNIICRDSLGPTPWGPSDNQIFCGTGATAFDTFDNSVLSQNAVRYYDQTGNLMRQVIHFDADGQWSNALTGAAAPYTQHNIITDVLAVPGDFGSRTETETGNIVFTLPHEGALAVDAGRVTTAPDGSIDFASAQHDLLSYFQGDTSALQQLCAALGA